MNFAQGQLLYRVEDTVSSDCYIDEWGDLCFTGHKTITISLKVFTVERATPKGAWIYQGLEGDNIREESKWISAARHRPFVRATKEEALEDAQCRRRYHVKMARERLELTERRLEQLEMDWDFGG